MCNIDEFDTYNMDDQGIQLGIGKQVVEIIDCNQNKVYGLELYFTLPRIIHMESMEGGVDSRNSRWNPWNGGWIP